MPAKQSESSKSIALEGPYQYMPGPKSVFNQDTAQTAGIYLWTIERDGRFWINYVGISTRPIGERLQEHLVHYYCGDYTIYHPERFAQGAKEPLYRPTGSVLDFAPHFLDLAPNIDAFVKLYSLFIAKVDGDKTWLERIESGMINQLRSANEEVAGFLDNYRISRDHPEDDKQSISVSAPVPLEGLGNKIRV